MAATRIRWCPICSAPRCNSATPAAELRCCIPKPVYSDTLVYEGGDTSGGGWQGGTVTPYRPSTNFGAEGQILYRKLDQASGLPVADTDTLADWAQDPADFVNGRRTQYPGWALERFFRPRVSIETANLEVLVAPDNSYAALKSHLEAAQAEHPLRGLHVRQCAPG